MPPAKHKHRLIQGNLRIAFEQAPGLDSIVEIELGFRPSGDHEYRIAEVALVSRNRWERIPPEGYLDGAPDLVVEVLSPSNSASEMQDKEQMCLENGCREFWIVDPVRRQIRVSTPGGRFLFYRDGQQVPLPNGGSLAVTAVFA